jgi:hypothetical protein
VLLVLALVVMAIVMVRRIQRQVSASPLDSLVLAAHVEKVCIRGNEVV